MKKKIFVLAVVVLMAYLAGSVAIACDKDQYDGNDHQSHVGELNLYQKCPQKPNVDFCMPVPGGFPPFPPLPDLSLGRVGEAWGKMKYNLQGPTFDFEFEGHHLQPGTYTLIYFPENFYGGSGVIYLGSDTATGNVKGHGDEDGNVQITGSLATGNLPGLTPYDYNCIPASDGLSCVACTWNDKTKTCTVGGGAKIWLVLSEDVCFRSPSGFAPSMIDWNPDKYLFGAKPINFKSSGVDVCD
ncbi:MAG: hypothetical protein ABSH06_00845 [Thermodesulfobacteriota bacterium]